MSKRYLKYFALVYALSLLFNVTATIPYEVHAARKSAASRRVNHQAEIRYKTNKRGVFKSLVDGRGILKTLINSPSTQKLSNRIAKVPRSDSEKAWLAHNENNQQGVFAIKRWVRVLDSIDGMHDIYLSERNEIAFDRIENRNKQKNGPYSFGISLKIGRHVYEKEILSAIQFANRLSTLPKDIIRTEGTFTLRSTRGPYLFH